MFKRKWSALPADPHFPSDLLGLGYFINKDDEVRSIGNEDNYFKFFINRNPRICERQRFAMNQAIQAEIHTRLLGLGLKQLFLPVSANDTSEARVPILVSADILKRSRVVVIFGETHQDLGVLAHRVLGGQGGIDKGSLVSVVKALQQNMTSPTDSSAPGLILANMGELIWWPEGGRTLCKTSFDASPMRSAAHLGNYIDAKVNRVPGNESPIAHVRYIFENVIPTLVSPAAGLDIIGLGDGADMVESYLNCNEVWERLATRLNCFASVGGQFIECDLKCDGLRDFLKHRARAYVPSIEPLGLLLSGFSGNPNTTTFTSFGCPVFSAGESQHVETLFIACYQTVLSWLQEVADTPTKNKPYQNPVFTVVYSDTYDGSNDWTDWVDEGMKPTDGLQAVNDESNDTMSTGELRIVTRDGVKDTNRKEAEDAARKTGEEDINGVNRDQTQYPARPKPGNDDI